MSTQAKQYFLITLKDGADVLSFRAHLLLVNTGEERPINYGSIQFLELAGTKVVSLECTQAVADLLATNPNVSSVEPDVESHTSS